MVADRARGESGIENVVGRGVLDAPPDERGELVVFTIETEGIGS